MPPRTAIAPLLNASIVGEGERVLVLGNGLGTTQRTWRHIVAAFRSRYRIVQFDYVGTPDADAVEFEAARYQTLHGHADDVLALLDELEVRDATWIGHSVSGMIGVLAGVARPDCLSHLVLVSASPRYLDDDGYVGGFTPAALADLLSAAAADYHAWVAGFSPLAVGHAAVPELVEEFAATLRRMRPDVASRTLTTVLTGDYRALLPRVTQPVTVIQPQSDVAVPPAVGRYLAAQLPHAEFHEIAAVGHVPHLTSPAAVIAVLEQVLEQPLAGARRAA